MSVSYSKKMRADAEANGGSLLTIDIPGMSYQTPAGTGEHVSMLLRVWNWIQNPKCGFKRIDIITDICDSSAMYVDGVLKTHGEVIACDIANESDGLPAIVNSHYVHMNLHLIWPKNLEDLLSITTESNEVAK